MGLDVALERVWQVGPGLCADSISSIGCLFLSQLVTFKSRREVFLIQQQTPNMSFGFSISDFIFCAQLTYRLYVELKGAPAACQSLSKELLLFAQVMRKTQLLLEKQESDLDDLDRDTLETCLESCKNILFIQILGDSSIPEELPLPDDIRFDTPPTFNGRWGRFYHGLGEKIKQRRLALKIPKLQSEISANVEKLTAFNVLLIQYASLCGSSERMLT